MINPIAEKPAEAELAGAFAALLTGFEDNGDYSPRRQAAIVEYVANQDLRGLYVGGSSGEDGLMQTDELLKQQADVAEMTKGMSRKLIAHVGRPSLRCSLRLAQAAQENEYDAISALPPHAYPFSESEILDYYAALCEVSSLPMIVYEIPVRTKQPLSLGCLSKLLSMSTVVGIKFTSTDLFKLAQLRAAHPQAKIFFGFDEVVAGAAPMQINGGIGTTYNVLGSLYSDLLRAIEAGDLEKMTSLQKLSQKLVMAMLDVGVIPATKLALQALGVDAGSCRAPFSIRSVEGAKTLQTLVRSADFMPWIKTHELSTA